MSRRERTERTLSQGKIVWKGKRYINRIRIREAPFCVIDEMSCLGTWYRPSFYISFKG